MFEGMKVEVEKEVLGDGPKAPEKWRKKAREATIAPVPVMGSHDSYYLGY